MHYSLYHWFRQWLGALDGAKPLSEPSWNIVNWTLRNKLQWNLNRNSYIFIQENTFEHVIWKMAAILSGTQCVKLSFGRLSHFATALSIVVNANSHCLWTSQGNECRSVGGIYSGSGKFWVLRMKIRPQPPPPLTTRSHYLIQCHQLDP